MNPTILVNFFVEMRAGEGSYYVVKADLELTGDEQAGDLCLTLKPDVTHPVTLGVLWLKK